jgi:4-hydroxybenzoate polyprenyltransferase
MTGARPRLICLSLSITRVRAMQGTGTLPLVADLDGALMRTALLGEAATYFATRRLLGGFSLATWSLRSRGTLAARLGNECELDAACLPYRQSVVDWLHLQKEQGRRLVLATAFPGAIVDGVWSHLGLFDEVLKPRAGIGATAESKRGMLVGRYGEQGFDYVGGSRADLPVYGAAARVYLVGAAASVEAKVRSSGKLAEVVERRSGPPLQAVGRALRPHQWVKNLLVLVPLLFAHRYTDRASVAHALLALVVFCLLASSAYVLNDLLDLQHDRRAPYKRDRPLASGSVGLLTGWMIWPLLLILAFVIGGFLLPGRFLAAMGAYLVLTFAYSFRLKQIAVVDVLALASLYTLRIVAGAEAIDVHASFWLLAFSVFLFLSLAFVKRFSGLKAARESGNGAMVAGRDYVEADLDIVSSLGVAAGYIAVLVLALYINDSHTAELYRSPLIIWLTCPILLYWITRVWLLAHRGVITEDPIVFALRDRASWVVAVLLVLLFILARVVP